MGKEETAHYEEFLLFPQCFQKLSVADVLKIKGLKGSEDNDQNAPKP